MEGFLAVNTTPSPNPPFMFYHWPFRLEIFFFFFGGGGGGVYFLGGESLSDFQKFKGVSFMGCEHIVKKTKTTYFFLTTVFTYLVTEANDVKTSLNFFKLASVSQRAHQVL